MPQYRASTDNSGDQLESLLPEELERYIFEMAARSHSHTATVLARVARRAQVWMEHIIYNTVTLSDSGRCRRFLSTVDVRPHDFFIQAVKSLCIPGDIRPEQATRILAVCQGVANLAYWITILSTSPPFALISENLRPIKLSFNTYGLFHLTAPPDFTLPFFSRVTHLEIVDWPFISASCRFERLPSLTHLAVDIDQYGHAVVLELRRILDNCQRLKVLLCLVREETMADVQVAFRVVGDDDPRLVILPDSEPLESWEASLEPESEGCQWSRAERMVDARRIGLRQG